MDEEENDINPEDFGMQGAFNAMGKMGLSIFRAVMRDGGSWNEAFSVTSAFFAGSIKANAADETGDS